LETAIATAEGRAYQESALPMPSPPVNTFRAESILFSSTFVAILILSFAASLGTMVFAVRGLNR
jgi:hypothetical protein